MQSWHRSPSAACRAACSCSIQPGPDTFGNHGSLELGENAQHLKHSPAAGCGGVQALLFQVEADPEGVQLTQEGHQILQAPPKAVYRPCSDKIKLAARSVLAELVEGRALVPPLGAADACILVDFSNLLACRASNRLQLATLILGRLLAR